jgi:hypothetical protein
LDVLKLRCSSSDKEQVEERGSSEWSILESIELESEKRWPPESLIETSDNLPG